MYVSSFRFPSDFFADFDALQRQLDQAFDSRLWPSSIRAISRNNAFPAINVGNTSESVEIYAFLPGVNASAIEVSVDKGVLTIAGERTSTTPPAAEQAGNKLSVYARERSSGKFRRVVNLPEDVDAERVNADYRNGVLHISIAKREASKPRRIEVH
jgi:HSP20 family protein